MNSSKSLSVIFRSTAQNLIYTAQLSFIIFLFAFTAPALAQNSSCPSGSQDLPSPEQIEVIRSSMSSRDHRLWHYLWHSLRGGWAALTEEERNALKSKLPAVAIPPRPFDWNNAELTRNNLSGEDFLFMHWTMSRHLNTHLQHQGLCPISSWSHLPEPSDKRYLMKPGAPDWPWSSIAVFRFMQFFEEHLKDKSYLSSITLGQLGYDIEVTIHNLMHVRWTVADSFAERPKIPLDGQLPSANWVWDDPNYIRLSDPYASHINPIFYKLHGWIDDRVSEWLKANGYKTIAKDCSKQPDSTTCYQWKGTWLGLGVSMVDEAHSRMGSIQPSIMKNIATKLDAAGKIRPAL